MVFRIRPVSTPAEIKLGHFLIISARTKYPIIVSCVRYSDCRRQRRPIFSNAQKQCVVPPHPAVSRRRSWTPLWRRVVVLLPSLASMVRSASSGEQSDKLIKWRRYGHNAGLPNRLAIVFLQLQLFFQTLFFRYYEHTVPCSDSARMSSILVPSYPRGILIIYSLRPVYGAPWSPAVTPRGHPVSI